jgi:hypothetical protein
LTRAPTADLYIKRERKLKAKDEFMLEEVYSDYSSPQNMPPKGGVSFSPSRQTLFNKIATPQDLGSTNEDLTDF